MKKIASNWLIVVIALMLLAVISYRFDQYYIQKNYTFVVNTSCDPRISDCFSLNCSTADDPECDDSTYKKVEISAYDAPKCLEEHSCDDFACPLGSSQCSITYCTEDMLEEWEMCVVPQTYE